MYGGNRVLGLMKAISHERSVEDHDPTVLISLVRYRSAGLSRSLSPWALDDAAVRTTADPPVLFPAAVELLVVGLHVH